MLHHVRSPVALASVVAACFLVAGAGAQPLAPLTPSLPPGPVVVPTLTVPLTGFRLPPSAPTVKPDPNRPQPSARPAPESAPASTQLPAEPAHAPPPPPPPAQPEGDSQWKVIAAALGVACLYLLVRRRRS